MHVLIPFILAALSAVGVFTYTTFDEPTVGAVSVFKSVQLAASPSNGDCLSTDGTNNIWDTCATGGGDGGGGGTWSTTTSTVAGQLVNFSNNTSDIVAIGANSTTTAEFWFDPNTLRSLIPFSSSTAMTITSAYLTNLFIGADTIAEYISDTAGAMWTGNTETGISITYQDADNTIDAVVSGVTSAMFADADWGDITLASGVASVEDDSHAHTSTTVSGLDISADTNLTAGDALTLTDDDIDFDGGATPAGDLGGTWASPSVTDDSHAHTSTTISGLDVSADLNLTGGVGLTLTGDDMACDTGSGTVFGCITAANWTTFNNKWDLASSTIPIAKGGTGLTAVGASSTVLTTNGTIMIWQNIATYVESIISAASLVLTGNWDFGGATGLEIPNGTAPTVNATGEHAWDTTSGQQIIYDGAATRVLSNGYLYPAFTYATSTAWAGTTTIPLGPAFVGETWSQVMCFTNAGTLNVAFNDGTNFMQYLNASTTVGTFNVSTNNTFTAAEKRYVNIGTPASSPTKISCTVRKAITAD